MELRTENSLYGSRNENEIVIAQAIRGIEMVPPRIWLVGVDAQMGSTLSVVLSSLGFAAEQVAEKQLTFGRDPKPTAILLSVVEAGMPALSHLVWARKWSPPIPVFVLVAPDQRGIAAEALKLGATDTVVMPADPADLLAVLRPLQQKDE